MNYSFTKQLRLQKSVQFKFVSTRGKRLKGRFFVVIYKITNENNRLGVTASKKCSKKAVERNRLKRIIRESFRHSQAQFSAYDIVVIARHWAVNATNQELFSELAGIWKKLAKE